MVCFLIIVFVESVNMAPGENLANFKWSVSWQRAIYEIIRKELWKYFIIFTMMIKVRFSRLKIKFEVCVSCAALCDVFVRFFWLMFWNRILFSPVLLNIGFTLIQWNWFVLWWGILGNKVMQMPRLSYKMVMFA